MVWQALIAGVVTIILAWMQQRTKGAVDKSAAIGQQNADKIEIIHRATNSMKDELVREVRAAAFAQGEKSAAESSSRPPQPPGN